MGVIVKYYVRVGAHVFVLPEIHASTDVFDDGGIFDDFLPTAFKLRSCGVTSTHVKADLMVICSFYTYFLYILINILKNILIIILIIILINMIINMIIKSIELIWSQPELRHRFLCWIC